MKKIQQMRLGLFLISTMSRDAGRQRDSSSHSWGTDKAMS